VEEEMKVLGIPVKDMTLGSCRTRYYYMLKYLPEGWEWEQYRRGAQGDVLYIQKIETPEVWSAVKDCKRRGIPIVYERDDFCKPWNTEHTKIMDASDAVTIISEGLLRKVQKRTRTKCYHVFDGFDYEIKKDERAPIREKLRRVVTYGRQANIHAAAKYYRHVKYEKAYFGDRPIKGAGRYIEWRLKKFKRKLAKWDVILVAHALNHRKEFKDIGRAMVGFAMGIPVLHTTSIEAKRIYSKLGYPWMILKKPEDIRGALKRLKPHGVRQEISDAFYEYAWANWRPDQASAKLADVFMEVIRAKANALPG
jgi:hypothetical protein